MKQLKNRVKYFFLLVIVGIGNIDHTINNYFAHSLLHVIFIYDFTKTYFNNLRSYISFII